MPHAAKPSDRAFGKMPPRHILGVDPMSSIGAVNSQPPAPPPPPTTKVDRDGDHDNDATESAAAKAQESAGASHALNITA